MPEILEGLRDGEFVFYVQPICDLNTRAIIGGEALMRWSHGDYGLVPLDNFIPLVEANGYITKLDQYIWEEVCKTSAAGSTTASGGASGHQHLQNRPDGHRPDPVLPASDPQIPDPAPVPGAGNRRERLSPVRRRRQGYQRGMRQIGFRM